MARSLPLALVGAAALAGQAAAVMNAGGLPYKVGNAGPAYSTEFSKESPLYFDSYAEVQTRYSQVWWTRSANIPLPPDIVERFAGKVMAITGYEVDQVMNPHVVNGTCLTELCKKSDLSVSATPRPPPSLLPARDRTAPHHVALTRARAFLSWQAHLQRI